MMTMIATQGDLELPGANSARDWRSDTSRWLMGALALLLAVMTPTLGLAVRARTPRTILLFVLGIILAAILWETFRPWLSPVSRRRLIVCTFLALGSTAYGLGGIAGNQSLVMGLAVLMAGLLLGKRAMLATALVALLIASLVGGLMSAGRIPPPPAQDVSPEEVLPWVRVNVIASSIWVFTGLLIVSIVDVLEGAIRRSQEERARRVEGNRERDDALALSAQAQTNRDQALAALTRSEEELRSLAKKLTDTNRDLERRVQERTADLAAANKELEAFSFTVSHDLRAPLRTVQSFAELLRDEEHATLGDEGRHIVERMVEGAHRMESLIESLLEFSRASRGPLSAQSVDMAKLAREATQEILAARGGAKASVEIGALPVVRGDQSLLRQVLLNLIGNALKFCGKQADPTVEIRAQPGEKETIFWVKDNGAGFDPSNAEKLFGVFQRLHGETEFEGTGLGLAIVQRIIARHGGRVWAQGEVGKGATFSFSMPTIQATPSLSPSAE